MEEDEEEEAGGEGEKVKDQSWKEKVERKQKHKNHTEWRRHKEAKELRKASVFVLTTTQEAAVVWAKGQ